MIVNGVEFHDLPLSGIEFVFAAREIIVSCEAYNETTSDYDPIKVYFIGVQNIFTDLMEIEDSTDMEIFDLELEESNGTKEARFHILTGFSKPDMHLTFNYSEVRYSW